MTTPVVSAERRWTRRPRGAPLVIGHRGAMALELENTLAAFRRARADGADGVELDVCRCATGEIVVFHDDDLTRLAGRKERIRELPLAALREVRLAGGQTIPLLDEVLDELGDDFLVNVELKATALFHGQRLAPAVAALLVRRGTGERVLVSSFNPFALARFRLAAPALPSALLFEAGSHFFARADARRLLRPRALHPERVLVTAARVEAWHAAGYAVNVWTVNEPAELLRLAELGVDGLVTNDPGAARRVLAGQSAS